MINFFRNRKISTLLLIGIAVLTFLVLLGLAALSVALVNVLSNKLKFEVYTITFLALLGFSIILSISTTVLFYIMAKKAQKLIDGLTRVAAGDYSAEIEYRRGDTFTGVYKNFNKMTSELRSVKTMRDDFVNNFSHEIKTPLFSIQGFANLLLEGGLTEEEKQKFLTVISEEAGRLGRLADSTLLLSKLENQQLLSDRATLKLDAEITDCIIMLEREWDGKHIEICSDLSPVKVEGDGAMLRQVWVNLLSNAVKFTPEGGRIEITLRREGGFAVVTVKDSGCGIAEGDIARIFDKYYRAPSAKDTEGNGLGLAICKRACTLAGGEISVKSKPGEGSIFTVRLPL